MKILNIDKDCNIVLDTQANEYLININKCRAIITDVSVASKVINVNDGDLDYCFIKKDNTNEKLNINVYKGNVNARIIDISKEDSTNSCVLDLQHEDSEIEFSVASIARLGVKKDYNIRSENNARNTFVKIDCFGISENNSSIKYDITSFIKKGSKKSVVNQNSKILLFDKESVGVNNPVLEIEENEVKANHGSSIGMIDEETLFYLTSRGISEKDARDLVSLGKINYMIETIKDEKIKKELINEI